MANPFMPPEDPWKPLSPWEEEKQAATSTPDTFTVNANLLTQGQTEKSIFQAQTVLNTPKAAEPEPTSVDDAMRKMGSDMANPNINRDEAWWQKSLGALAKLAYLGVPMELAWEAAEGVIPGQWWGEGTAPREDFEAWKALFGENKGGFWERMDAAVAATEKRPLIAQLAMAGTEIAATLGTGAIARGIAMGGSNGARIAAAMTRGGGYLLDPTEAGLRYIGHTFKTARTYIPSDRRNPLTGQLEARPGAGSLMKELLGQPTMDFYRFSPMGRALGGIGFSDIPLGESLGKGEIPPPWASEEVQNMWGSLSTSERLDTLFRYTSDPERRAYVKYATSLDKQRGLYEPQIAVDVRSTANKNVPWQGELPPVLKRGNEFRRLFGDLWRDIQNVNNSGIASEKLSPTTMKKSRDLALIQVQLGLASRPGAIANATVKDLRKFIDTGLFEVREAGRGFRSGNLIPYGEQNTTREAVQMYYDKLTEWADVNGIKLNDDTKVFQMGFGEEQLFMEGGKLRSTIREVGEYATTGTGNKSGDNLTRRIISAYTDIGENGVKYELTSNAKTIRNQRISEMWLEGKWTFQDIKDMLGHSGDNQVRGYIHDIDVFVGQLTDVAVEGGLSEPLAKLLAGDGILDSLRAADGSISYTPANKVNYEKLVEALSEVTRAARLEDVWGKRKSKQVGGALEEDLVIRVGDIFLDSKELDIYISTWDKEKLAEWSNNQVASHSNGVLKAIAEETMKIQAIRRLALNMELGYNTIYHKYRGIVAAGEADITSQGKLKRAGFSLKRGKKGKLNLIDDTKSDITKVSEKAIAARSTYGTESGLGSYLKTGKQWNDWAKGLADESETLRLILSDKAHLKDTTGRKRKQLVHQVLQEYVDVKAGRLWQDWQAMDMQVDNLGIGPIAYFESTLRDLMYYSRSSGMSQQQFNNTGGALWRIGYNTALKDQRQTSLLDPFDWNRVVDGPQDPNRVVTGFLDADVNHQNMRVKNWLNHPDVRVTLRMKGLKSDLSAKAIQERIFKVAGIPMKLPRKLSQFKADQSGTPELFGPGFNKLITPSNNPSLTPAQNRDANAKKFQQAIDMIQSISTKISLHSEDWLAEYGQKDWSKYKDMLDGKDVMPELRFGSPDISELESPLASGAMPSSIIFSKNIDQTQERVNTNSFFKKYTEDERGSMGFFGRYVVAPVYAAVAGGRAAVGRSPVAILSARGWNNAWHTRMARELMPVFRAVMASEALGLKEVPLHPVYKERKTGVRTGNQIFPGLELNPKEYIRSFEGRKDVQDTFYDIGMIATGGKKSRESFLPPLAKIQRVLADEGIQADAYAKGVGEGLENPDNLLRQVDMVLEYIPEKYWKEYFANIEDAQGNKLPAWHALMFIKESQRRIDEVARARGVDLVGAIREAGGRYLANFLPRIFAGQSPVQLGQQATEIGGLIPNSFVPHFQRRTQENVFEHLRVAVNPQNYAGDPDKLGRSVFQPVENRIAMYYETMMKEADDIQTQKALLRKRNLIRAVNSDVEGDWNQNVLEVKNFESVLNARMVGLELTPDQIDGLKSAVHTKEYIWIADSAKKITTEEETDMRNLIGDLKSRLNIVKDMEQPTAVTATGWLGEAFKRMSPADQQAAREQLELVAPFILKPFAAIGKGLYGFTNILRTLKAGLDVGAPMIHGYNALVRMPAMEILGPRGEKLSIHTDTKLGSQKAWLTGVKEMYRNLWNPDRLDDYNVKNINIRLEAGQWVKLGHSEPLAALMGESSTMANARRAMGDKAAEWWGKDHVRLMDRFEKGFVGYTDVLRIELYKSFQPSLDRGLIKMYGPKMKELIEQPGNAKFGDKRVRAAYHEMGAVINKMTGVYDQELAGMTPLQRILESSIIFFAPMYRRATYGIIADIRQGGMRRQQALSQLSGVIGVGAMMGALFEFSGNNDRAFVFDKNGEPDLTSRFGKFNVAGVQMGIGTAWWTAFRAASDLAMLAYHGDDTIEEGNANLFFDNPLVEMLGRRGRSQLAPGAGYLLDIIQGRTFVGDPLRDEGEWDIGQIMRHTGRSAYPFWLDGAFSGGFMNAGTPTMMISEALGLQAYEISTYDKLQGVREHAVHSWQDEEIKEWRDNLGPDETEDWVSMPKLLQDRINKYHPDVVNMLAKFEEERQKTAIGTSRIFLKYMEKKSVQEKSAQDMIANATLQFERGDISGRDMATIINQAKIFRSKANIALLDSKEYRPLTEWFIELRHSNNKKKDKAFHGDILYDMWQAEVVHHPSTEESDGSYNWEVRRTLENQFFAENLIQKGDEWHQYIMDRQRAWMQTNPVLVEFETAKEQLGPYWRIANEIWPPGSEMNRKAIWYMEQSDAGRAALTQQMPVFKEIERTISKARNDLRYTNPHIDWLLVKWYGYSPRNLSTANRLQQWQEGQRLGRIQEAQFPESWPWSSPKKEWLQTNATGRIIVNRQANQQLTQTQ